MTINIITFFSANTRGCGDDFIHQHPTGRHSLQRAHNVLPALRHGLIPLPALHHSLEDHRSQRHLLLPRVSVDIVALPWVRMIQQRREIDGHDK